MKMKLIAVVAGVVLLMGASAFADSWNFASPTGVVTSPHTYASTAGVDIVAAGFLCSTSTSFQCASGDVASNSNVNMWGKNTLTESGLGLAGQPEGEIGTNGYIALDLSQVFAHYGSTITLLIGSMQTGENALFWQNSSAGTLGGSVGVLLGAGSNVPNGKIMLTLHQSDGQYLQIGANGSGGHNVLLTAASTPEPASMLLLGSGLIGLGGLFRRRINR